MTRSTRAPSDRIITGQHVAPVKLERAKALRRALTPAERRLWAALRHNQLRGLHWRRQQVLDGFILDFYCHPARLVVELDGASHAGRAEYDSARDAWARARGLRVLRFRNVEVEGDLPAVLRQIVRAADEQAAEAGE